MSSSIDKSKRETTSAMSITSNNNKNTLLFAWGSSECKALTYGNQQIEMDQKKTN